MKTVTLIAAGVFAILVAKCMDLAKTNPAARPVDVPALLLAAQPSFPFIRTSRPVSTSDPFLLQTNSARRLPATHLAPPDETAFGTALPRPGVYEARPYTAIVIVPGPHPDERCIIGRQGQNPSLPAIRPELWLVPREGTKEKSHLQKNDPGSGRQGGGGGEPR